jgi:hypothetical protein
VAGAKRAPIGRTCGAPTNAKSQERAARNLGLKNREKKAHWIFLYKRQKTDRQTTDNSLFVFSQCILPCKKFSTCDMDFFEFSKGLVLVFLYFPCYLLYDTKNAIKQQQKPFNKKSTKNEV